MTTSAAPMELPDLDTPDEAVPEPRSEWSRRWARFRRNRLAMVGLVIIAVIALAAIFAPVIAPYDYTTLGPGEELLPTGAPGHLLGTDLLGRDVLSRIIYSLRTALIIAISAEALSLIIALIIGLTAGYLGGRVDQILMAGTDIMYAFPSYLFAVLLVAIMGRSMIAVIIALTIASWVGQCRLMRAQIMRLKTLEYVEAGRSMGASGITLVVRYMLPNSLGPILVTSSFGIPANMLAESGLSLLGLGVAPPTPSVGSMIIDGYRYVMTSPSLILWPVVLFALTMLAFTWIGDGFRDAFDVDET